MLDLIIRNGTIVDGTGMPGFTGDIGIKDGKIAVTGSILETAAEEIDASGKICLLYTAPSPRDGLLSLMPSSA